MKNDETIEYIGRADFIDDADLIKWTVESKHFSDIQKKLTGREPVLIAGPRGSGKTHQMKFVYHQCINDNRKPMAVYVTFGKYYHLEPFLFKESNAIHIFRTWVLGKIVSACIQLIRITEKGNGSEHIGEFEPVDDLEKFISQLETGVKEDWHEVWISKLTIHRVTRFLERTALILKRKRVVLLLDDAALTLTPDYLKEFFDVFRGLRTLKITPKASVYPGTTQYGPGFHLGHDAEKVEIWFNPEESGRGYADFLDELIDKRLPGIKEKFSLEIIELLKYASFGLPRAFLNLLKNFGDSNGKNLQERFNKVIEEQSELIKAEYLSLKKKMPQYKSIIGVGFQLFERIVEEFVSDNKKRLEAEEKNEKQVVIGISREKELTFSRMIKFLNEAGLLYELGAVKHGEEREYDRYVPHLLFLIKNRAFSSGRGFGSKRALEFMRRKSTKHPLRRTFKTLLKEEQIKKIKLDLPSCTNCGTERLTERQRFCHNCGVELVEKSRYEACLNMPIEELPITLRQKEIIKKETSLKTVGDILASPAPGSDLQDVKYIGPKRSEKILGIVKKTVEEFLG
ncbi:MAG: zinc ribbon domain-containing protein [bacterium]|nr:zinc ribbon domain-containing protein [bacterium]